MSTIMTTPQKEVAISDLYTEPSTFTDVSDWLIDMLDEMY